MDIALIPVIEIWGNSDGIDSPDNGPSWKYPKEWQLYDQECLKNAGFEVSGMKSYQEGLHLYTAASISMFNLTKLVVDEVKEAREDFDDPTQYNDEDYIAAFSGGYILTVDGQEKLYPQCCGDLRDIYSWENLLIASNGFDFWIGHPSPSIISTETSIIFDLKNSNVNESYVPALTDYYFGVDKSSLQQAINQAKEELNVLAEKIQEINIKEKLNVNEIGKLFIFGQ